MELVIHSVEVVIVVVVMMMEVMVVVRRAVWCAGVAMVQWQC